MLNHFDGIISHCSIKVTPDREVSNTSSASGQDEPNRAMWLATRAGKVETSCSLGTTRCIPQETLPRKPYNKSFIDHVCSVKMAKYWPRSFFASLWTSTSSRSINTQKKNLANIQPSWPYTWSIAHVYCDWVASVFRQMIITFMPGICLTTGLPLNTKTLSPNQIWFKL